MSQGSSSDLIAASQAAAPLTCNLTQYKASTGLTSALEGGLLTVSWNGQGTSQLRARFAIDNGTPTIRDLSVRRGGSGEWAMLGQNLTPEYQVTTGLRRMSNDQANAFASLGIDVTQEVIAAPLNAFWTPFSIPGYRRRRARGGARGAAGVGPAARLGAGADAGQGGRSPSGSSRSVRQRGGQATSPNRRATGGRGGLPRTRGDPRGVPPFGFVVRGQDRRQQPAVTSRDDARSSTAISDSPYRGTNRWMRSRTNEPWVAYSDAG
jgi:hypothetical protein